MELDIELILIIISVWLAVSVVAALAFGAMIRLRDRREAHRYDNPDDDIARREDEAFHD